MKRCIALLALSILACGRAHAPPLPGYLAGDSAPQPESAPPSPAPPVVAEPPPPPPSAAAPRAALLRLVEQTGTHADAPIEGLGRVLSTGRDGHITLDLPNGARVQLDANSRACVLELEPSALLLFSGSAQVELLPQGNPAGLTALRLISSQGSLSVPNVAELFMAERVWSAPPARTTLALQSYLGILRGSAEWQRFGADDALHAETVVAGQELASGNGPKPPQAKTLADARRSSAELLRRKSAALRWPDVDARLERALSQVAEERQHGTELIARLFPHANAPAAPTLAPVAARAGSLPPSDAAGARADSAGLVAGPQRAVVSEVRAYQRSLAVHAQRRHQLRQTLLLAAEQSLFGALAACASHNTQEADCEALSAWRTRYLGRIQAAL
jgi:hypothetical protein